MTMTFGQCLNPFGDDLDDFGNQGDFYLKVAKGLVPGHSFIQKFGHNDSVGNNNYEDIWDDGGKADFQTSAQTLDVESNDSEDDAGNNGARTVEIQGLDANYDLLTETITMNGTSDVTTTGSFLRVFRMKVLTAGNDGQNEGDIFARYSSTNDLAAKISYNPPDGESQTLMAIYTVPNGKTAYLQHWYWKQQVKEAAIRLRVRELNSVFQTKSFVSTEGPGDIRYTTPIVIPAKSDILIDAQATTGSHNVSAGFDLILVDD